MSNNKNNNIDNVEFPDAFVDDEDLSFPNTFDLLKKNGVRDAVREADDIVNDNKEVDQTAIEMEMIRQLAAREPINSPELTLTKTTQSKLKRKPRRKRGESLEDEIRKFILENEKPTAALEAQNQDLWSDGKMAETKMVNGEGMSLETGSPIGTTPLSATTVSGQNTVPSATEILSDLGKTADVVHMIPPDVKGLGNVDASSGPSNTSNRSLSLSRDLRTRDGHSDEEKKEEYVVHEEHQSNQLLDQNHSIHLPENQNGTSPHAVFMGPTIWGDDWTAFGSFQGGMLDENGFPILDVQSEKIHSDDAAHDGSTHDRKDDAHNDDGADADDEDSYSPNKEEKDLARALAEEFQLRERVLGMAAELARIEAAEGYEDAHNDTNGDDALDDISEIFDNLAVSTSEAIDDEQEKVWSDDHRQDRLYAAEFNENRWDPTYDKTGDNGNGSSEAATFLSSATANNLESRSSSHERPIIAKNETLEGARDSLSYDNLHRFGTEQQSRGRNTMYPSNAHRSHSPSSFSKEEATSRSSLHVLKDNFTESASEVSSSVTSSKIDDATTPSSPSSVTQFSDDSIRSQHQRYLHARAFVKKRRSRSRPSSRRAPKSPPQLATAIYDEKTEKSARSERRMELKWNPQPPKHYNRPLSPS